MRIRMADNIQELKGEKIVAIFQFILDIWMMNFTMLTHILTTVMKKIGLQAN